MEREEATEEGLISAPAQWLPMYGTEVLITWPSSALLYRNDPKYSDRQVWANSVDPGSRLFAVLSASFRRCIIKPHCSNSRIIRAVFSGV